MLEVVLVLALRLEQDSSLKVTQQKNIFMGSLEFRGISFKYFWHNLTKDTFKAYADRMESLFKEVYLETDFSSASFVNTFTEHLHEYDVNNGITYEFRTNDFSSQQEWRVYFYNTTIRHIEGGLVRDSSNEIDLDLSFVHRLIYQNLANVIIFKQHSPPKWPISIIKRNQLINYIGEECFIYLLIKIEKNKSLGDKFWWTPYHSNDFNYSQFIHRIESIFRTDTSEVMPQLSRVNKHTMPTFIKSCDDKIKSLMLEAEMNDMFALIGMSSEEWFNDDVN